MSTFFQRLFATSSDHATVIERAAQLTRRSEARALAKKHALDIVDLTWEDTGRYQGSAVGPNISDMTIQVAHAGRVTCMPVIRPPNFSDRTADIALDDIRLRVGNQRGAALANVSLRTYLGDLRRYLAKPGSWTGPATSLLAPRDREVLVSAQACFLPIPKDGRAEWNPVLFNYQSYVGSPAVLAIVATREGTSATLIDNARDGFGAGAAWGQRLFHNANGERASFTGTRMTEFVAAGGDATDRVTSREDAAGLSCVLLIQVPLKQRPHVERRSMSCFAGPSVMKCLSDRGDGDVDDAVIGHGEIEGPFTEIDGLAIERDPRFPIRVTVQFYKATSTGRVDASEMAALAAQIESVYRDAKTVGSLVCDPDRGRSTAWDDEGAGRAEPSDWWEKFWAAQEAATGATREELRRRMEELLGRRPTEAELEAAIRRVFFQ